MAHTLQEIIDAAINWEPKAPGNSWDIFQPLPDENEHEAMIRESAKLLALRIDRGCPNP